VHLVYQDGKATGQILCFRGPYHSAADTRICEKKKREQENLDLVHSIYSICFYCFFLGFRSNLTILYERGKETKKHYVWREGKTEEKRNKNHKLSTLCKTLSTRAVLYCVRHLICLFCCCLSCLSFLLLLCMRVPDCWS